MGGWCQRRLARTRRAPAPCALCGAGAPVHGSARPEHPHHHPHRFTSLHAHTDPSPPPERQLLLATASRKPSRHCARSLPDNPRRSSGRVCRPFGSRELAAVCSKAPRGQPGSRQPRGVQKRAPSCHGCVGDAPPASRGATSPAADARAVPPAARRRRSGSHRRQHGCGGAGRGAPRAPPCATGRP